MSENKQTVVVWFSCGAASAVAAYKTIELYGANSIVRVVNNPIKEEHFDNRRFLREVEEWIGQKIEFAINSKYPRASCQEVWDDRKYMSGINGAPCTVELKKNARYEFESKNHIDWHVLGFTSEEVNRYNKFIRSERDNVIPVLIEENMTKQDCVNFLLIHGIEIPIMYRLGYPNNNCVGCVKATSPTYWNHVRKVHKYEFDLRAKQSREIGCKLVRVNGKMTYLDELKETDLGRPLKELTFECGIFCEPEEFE